MFVDMTKPHPVNPHQEEEAATSGQQETTFSLDQHASPAAQVSTYLDSISTLISTISTIISTQDTQDGDGKPVIDSKPQIRVRNPPGGKSSIFF